MQGRETMALRLGPVAGSAAGRGGAAGGPRAEAGAVGTGGGGGGGGGGGPAGVTQPYFVDQKKGEVNELKALLRNISVERDVNKKRDVIKKVIAYMTLGIDVSRLFTEMILAIETSDIVVKKMVYLYLCNYAHGKPDLAIMCINTLQRDCTNDDPMVRGLALRSLCSLRLPTMVEYMRAPLQKSLIDPAAYVRKTGVMGLLKLYHLAPLLVSEGGMVDTLFDMLKDSDTQVVANVICVLNEIMAGEGGMAINRAIVLHLLGRVQHFNEWGLQHVLCLVCRYTPSDDEEIFTIMNLLDPVLRTSNGGVVMATCRCFFRLTQTMPGISTQVVERMKAPLLTLMASGGPELVYCILKHIETLIERAPGVFDDEFRHFYARYNEPTNVKYCKVDILSQVVTPASMTEVVLELSEYVSDVDSVLARRAIRAIGKICFRLADAADAVVLQLIDFLELDIDYVQAETCLVVAMLLRKRPHWRGDVLPLLKPVMLQLEENRAKAAVLWMVGRFGDEVGDAPYIVEGLIDKWEEEGSAEVKLQLLTTSVQLFFKRPAEMQGMLGRLLKAAVNDFSSQDVHDRALLYYRLLAKDPKVCEAVVCASAPTVGDAFADEVDKSRKDAIFKEFDTLSILYGKTSDEFTDAEFQIREASNIRRSKEEVLAEALGDLGLAPPPKFSNTGSDDLAPPQPPSAGGGASAVGDTAAAAGGGGALGHTVVGDTAPPAAVADLLGMDAFEPPAAAGADGLDFLNHQSIGGSGSGSGSGLVLQSTAVLEGGTFQSLWATLDSSSATATWALSRVPNSTEEVESALSKLGVRTMASGDKPEAMKLFVYGRGGRPVGGDTGSGGGGGGGPAVGDTAVHLAQVSMVKASASMEVVAKAEGEDGSRFIELLRRALGAYL